MNAHSVRNNIRLVMLAWGLITGIAFAAAPIAGADKVDDVFHCTDAGSSMKDCCQNAGGDYWTTVKNGRLVEGCSFYESKTAVIRDPDGLHVLGAGGDNSLPTRATTAPHPGETQLGPQ